jgi:hypothetical protein
MDKEELIYRDKGTSVFPDCPGNAGHFVGQGSSGFVMAASVLNVKSPGTKTVMVRQFLSATEYGSSAVDEEHAQIAVSPFGDATNFSSRAAGMFPGREAEIRGEVTTGRKALDITDKGH